MSDHCISIVPKLSNYPDREQKANDIVNWLVSFDIVKPTLSDCILASDNGYAISDGANNIVNEQEYLPFGLITNGLEVITNRQVFHTGGNGLDELICPNCKQNLASEDWDFFGKWEESDSTNVNCPACNISADIHEFTFIPEWGFSDLGFTFWNCPDFTNNFISDFKKQLDCEVNVVYTRI